MADTWIREVARLIFRAGGMSLGTWDLYYSKNVHSKADVWESRVARKWSGYARLDVWQV